MSTYGHTARLAQELFDLQKRLYEAAEWLVHDLGYPFDIGCDVAPPKVLRDAILQVAYDDRDRDIHGGELTREQVLDFIEGECPAWRSTTPAEVHAFMPQPGCNVCVCGALRDDPYHLREVTP